MEGTVWGRACRGFLLTALLLAGCTLPEVRTAERLAAQGDWDGATAAYRAAARKDPFNEDLRAALDGARAKAAEVHYAEGTRLLGDQQVTEALQEFNAALSLDPSRIEHQAVVADALRLKEARETLLTADKLRSLGRLDEALAAYERAVELDPGLTPALEAITALTRQQRAEQALGKTAQPITLRFQNARLKEVFEILARTGGINVVFDKEFRDDPISIFIKDTPFPDALNLILSTNNLFSRRIGPDTLLIIPNTKQKQDQYQDLMIRTFYLSNAKAKDLVNLVRTMLDSKRVHVNEPLNALVIRDQPDKLRLAERIILANDRRESEVVFDVEVLEVNRTKSERLGLSYAKNAGLGALPPGVTSLAAVASQFTFSQLTTIGPNSYAFLLPTTALLDFFKQESDAKTLAAPKVRVANNKKATINIGDKQPILLSTTNVLPGQAATGAVPTTSTVTSIEFKDTGVKLSIEPVIHLVNEVTLKLNIEVTRIGDKVTLQDSPKIEQFRFGTRTAETTLNLRDGETVVLAGLIQDEERKTKVTVPWLGDIPILGTLFTHTSTDIITTEVVLTLTPHVVRSVTTPGVEGQTFWSGTELTYATTPLYSTVPVSNAGARTGGPLPPRQPGDPQATTSPGGPPGTPVAPAPATATAAIGLLGLQPGELGAFVGQEFWVDVTAQGLAGLRQSTLTVTYDPNVLEFRRAEPGALLLADGGPGSLTIAAAPAAGRVDLHLQRPGAPAGGTGVLGRVLFLARSPGDAAVAIRPSDGSGPLAASGPGLVHVR